MTKKILLLKHKLLNDVIDIINERKLSKTDIMMLFNISKTQTYDLLNYDYTSFTLELLIAFTHLLGKEVSITIKEDVIQPHQDMALDDVIQHFTNVFNDNQNLTAVLGMAKCHVNMGKTPFEAYMATMDAVIKKYEKIKKY